VNVVAMEFFPFQCHITSAQTDTEGELLNAQVNPVFKSFL